MKYGKFSIIAVVFAVVFAPMSLALDSPVGSGRMPVTATQSGLVRSPNPIDRTSDLVVTGNVGGGKHFRGIVPYNAVTDFGAPTSTSTFDPFLRRSVDSGGYRSLGRIYNPYYSQTSTVTKALPGYAGVFRPPAQDLSYNPQAPQALDTSQITPEAEQRLLNLGYRPMSLTPQELEKSISSEVEKYSQKQQEQFIEQHRQMQLEKFKEQLQQISADANELQRSLIQDDDMLKQPQQPKWAEQPEQQFEEAEEQKDLDVYEQMKQIIEEIEKAEEQAPQKEQPDEEAPSEQEAEEVQPTDKLAEVSLSVMKARNIVGKFKTFASFVDDKFNRYLRAGENYLKEGKYYLAADAYTMASVYKPKDPLAYAGRSHALFAAGEYMSSALFLARALNIFPEYAAFKIELVSMIGDRDAIETRIAEARQWLEKSEAAELQFLLGYIYLQMDMLKDAQKAIDAAYEEMPDSQPVSTLKTVIDAAVNSSKTTRQP